MLNSFIAASLSDAFTLIVEKDRERLQKFGQLIENRIFLYGKYNFSVIMINKVYHKLNKL